MGVTLSQLADLTNTTLRDLPNMDFEVALAQQHYEVCDRWLQEDRVQIQSGYGIRRNIQLSQTGNAEHVNLYESTQVNQADTQVPIKSNWAHAQTYWSIERREAMMNSQPAAFVDLLKSKRTDAMVSLADLLEDRAWKSVDSTNDELNPKGLPYWISIGEDSEDGFEGRSAHDNSGNNIDDVGDIDATAYERWRNYFTDVDDSTDMDNTIDAMHKVYRKIRFRAPRIVSDLDSGPLANYRIYMNGTTIDAYEKYTRLSNDQIGYDVGKFAGNTAFQRVPIIWIEQLDSISTDIAGTNPIYFVNHNKFYPYVLRGDFLTESEPMKDREQHNVITTFVDLTYNYLCTDRRSQGVISQVS